MQHPNCSFCRILDLFTGATCPRDFARAKKAAETLTPPDQLRLVPAIIDAGRRAGVYS